VVRVPTAGDPPKIAAMVAALSARSLERRFLGTVPRQEALAELRRELRADADSVALLACDPAGEVVGEAYAARLDADSAEVAFVVADAWQSRGVGTLLRDALFEALRQRGFRYAVAELQWANVAMSSLLRQTNLRCTTERHDEGVLVVRVELEATPPGGLASCR